MNILEVNKLKKYYKLKSGLFNRINKYVKAVDEVSLKISKGESLGLVGESGSGKTTLSRLILKLENPDSGNIFFKERDITQMSEKKFIELRKKIQIIFQDPYSSLNPKHTVLDILTEALVHHKIIANKEKKEKAAELLELVGLDKDYMLRYPHEFSGGQRQRINIARAISLKPEFIVCDEPVSALDVSVQAQIINLLIDLKKKFNLSYLFITHDLSIVSYITDKLAVMNKGRIVEFDETLNILNNPKEKYTQTLINSVPKIL